MTNKVFNFGKYRSSWKIVIEISDLVRDRNIRFQLHIDTLIHKIERKLKKVEHKSIHSELDMEIKI